MYIHILTAAGLAGLTAAIPLEAQNLHFESTTPAKTEHRSRSSRTVRAASAASCDYVEPEVRFWEAFSPAEDVGCALATPIMQSWSVPSHVTVPAHTAILTLPTSTAEIANVIQLLASTELLWPLETTHTQLAASELSTAAETASGPEKLTSAAEHPGGTTMTATSTVTTTILLKPTGGAVSQSHHHLNDIPPSATAPTTRSIPAEHTTHSHASAKHHSPKPTPSSVPNSTTDASKPITAPAPRIYRTVTLTSVVTKTKTHHYSAAPVEKMTLTKTVTEIQHYSLTHITSVTRVVVRPTTTADAVDPKVKQRCAEYCTFEGHKSSHCVQDCVESWWLVHEREETSTR